ncbi:hypothetical protein JOD27_008859 [Lentzea nigeriaca]|nr:hypothetical protein [Lentzea nigeriaca]
MWRARCGPPGTDPHRATGSTRPLAAQRQRSACQTIRADLTASSRTRTRRRRDTPSTPCIQTEETGANDFQGLSAGGQRRRTVQCLTRSDDGVSRAGTVAVTPTIVERDHQCDLCGDTGSMTWWQPVAGSDPRHERFGYCGTGWGPADGIRPTRSPIPSGPVVLRPETGAPACCRTASLPLPDPAQPSISPKQDCPRNERKSSNNARPPDEWRNTLAMRATAVNCCPCSAWQHCHRAPAARSRGTTSTPPRLSRRRSTCSGLWKEHVHEPRYRQVVQW